MSDKLNTLIAYYEEEKAKLHKLIDNYLKEEEYQLAHFHQEALYQLNGRLQTLKNIDDKLYDEKSLRKEIIEDLEKRLTSETSDQIRNLLTEQLQRKRDELDKLNENSKQTSALENQSILDETLINLVEGEIQGFKLILKKSDSFLLKFSYYNKLLKVSLPFFEEHKENFILYDDNIETLHNLGFKLRENENELILELAGSRNEILNRIRIILSKIIFEIFYFKEFENESYIEIL